MNFTLVGMGDLLRGGGGVCNGGRGARLKRLEGGGPPFLSPALAQLEAVSLQIQG